jgi:hypothetical protein
MSTASSARGTGDSRDKIRTGTIQPGRPLPRADDVPRDLRAMCETWGYAVVSAKGGG